MRKLVPKRHKRCHGEHEHPERHLERVSVYSGGAAGTGVCRGHPGYRYGSRCPMKEAHNSQDKLEQIKQRLWGVSL